MKHSHCQLFMVMFAKHFKHSHQLSSTIVININALIDLKSFFVSYVNGSLLGGERVFGGGRLGAGIRVGMQVKIHPPRRIKNLSQRAGPVGLPTIS